MNAKENGAITKGERVELKSVVRNQFKVLRAEVEQREAELHAELEEEIAGRFSTEDATWAALQHAVHEAVMEANRRINDALREHGYEKHSPTEKQWVDSPYMRKPEAKRTDLRRLGATKIHERVRAAQLQLDRHEADLLRNLAVGALESDEARTFLNAIPTIGELVPSARLAEIEAGLVDEDDIELD